MIGAQAFLTILKVITTGGKPSNLRTQTFDQTELSPVFATESNGQIHGHQSTPPDCCSPLVTLVLH